MDEISRAWVYVCVLQKTITFSSVDVIEKMFIHSGYGNIRVVFGSNGKDNPLATFESNQIESTKDTIGRFDFITIRAFYHAIV